MCCTPAAGRTLNVVNYLFIVKNYPIVLSKRTVIGIVVGSVIIAIGLFALVTSFGIQTKNIDETFGLGESTTYQFTAPVHSKHFLNITGDSELRINGTLQFLSDPILITYHIVVITAGVIIIGFSAGFSIRKPRGF